MQQPNDESQSVDDNISKLYQIIEFKGKGAYGVIWKAIDKKTKKIVALKKVFDAFSNDTDAQRTYREVIYLQQLTQHENIVKLMHIHRAQNMKDLYMVFEYVESDLHKVTRANLLTLQHIQYVLYQTLKCLKYIHSGGLIHRDLKPSNILIDSECRIKIADFGLARLGTDIDESTVMTEYVATRWYRAPEILLGSPLYSKAVDMWSIGCIVGEMILGKSIFAGSSTLNQLEKIIEVIGRPTQDDLNSIQAPLADKIFRDLPTSRRKLLITYIKAPEDFLDFISKCLTWNPLKRMTVEEALQHHLMDDFRGSEPEVIYPSKIEIELSENCKLDRRKYRDILYKMDLNYQKTQQIRSIINEDSLPPTYKHKQSYTKYLNNAFETKQSLLKQEPLTSYCQQQLYQSHNEIQNSLILTKSMQVQQQNLKQRISQQRVKTLPENSVEKCLQHHEPKSPGRSRYFSQNKIPPQPQIPTSSTPVRSKSYEKSKLESIKNRKYNDSVEHVQNNSTIQKLLKTYLKPKNPTNYNFKKIAIRNKNFMDKTLIKKHIASIHNFDVGSVISIKK